MTDAEGLRNQARRRFLDSAGTTALYRVRHVAAPEGGLLFRWSAGSLPAACELPVACLYPVLRQNLVIVKIALQDFAEMTFTEYDQVIQTVTSDRSDQPFHEGLLPRTGRSGQDFLNA